MHVQVSLGAMSFTKRSLGNTWNKSTVVQLQQALPTLRSTSGDVDILVGRVDMNPWIQGVELGST